MPLFFILLCRKEKAMSEHEKFEGKIGMDEVRCGNCQTVYKKKRRNCPSCNAINTSFKKQQ
jgi:rubrerythrin